MRYTIGQFAGLHLVSKKTLRYYKEIGLLQPEGIDSFNGYAYYEDKQSERMKQIQYLRRLRFSLEEIGVLLDMDLKQWKEIVGARLIAVRSEELLLRDIEQELLALQERIKENKAIYQTDRITSEYVTDTFLLENPVYFIGRAARVPYNQNEKKQQMIESLIGDFYSNDEPNMILGHSLPETSLGIVCECEKDMSMGTYMMGMQVNCLDEIPEGMRKFTLPPGIYVRVRFRAEDRETLTGAALDKAYEHLYNKWLPESSYSMKEMLAVEVYREDRMESPVSPEMELWQLLAES